MSTNAEVQLREGETAEKLIKRFKKKVFKSKCLEIYKSKMYYEKKSDKKRKERKKKEYLIKKEERKRKENDKLG